MKIENGMSVLLKSFNGKQFSQEARDTQDDYWKLIGLKGKIIEKDNMNSKGRCLILFDNDLDKYKVANHNRIKNSLWINKSDLMISLEINLAENKR